jgi:hypothetical protein
MLNVKHLFMNNLNFIFMKTKILGGIAVYGNYSNCISGDSYTHCWDCESGCNAY